MNAPPPNQTWWYQIWRVAFHTEYTEVLLLADQQRCRKALEIYYTLKGDKILQ